MGQDPKDLKAASGEDFPLTYDIESGIAGQDVFAGEGEMAGIMQRLDWAATPLGPVQSWSPALRMMARFLLANRFPMLLWWGPQFCQLYNDAYRPILGTKHPHFLGRPVSECWHEIWHILEPLIRTPFEGGPPTWMEDILLEINRYGFKEESHFTIAYSPVPDETSPRGIGGVLATVHEITEKVVGERRTMALRDLGARSLETKTADEACTRAAEILANYSSDISFVLLYLFDSDCKIAHLAGAAGIEMNTPDAPAVIEMTGSAGIWPIAKVCDSEQMEVIHDLESKLRRVPPGPWSEPPNAAAVLPILSTVLHQPAGVLIAGLSPRLRFDDSYRGFLELTASQIATVIANATAYEEERKRAEALAELDRVKTTFFSNISHEFRTPLTLMLGPLEEVLAKPGEIADVRDLITVAQRNGIRLLKLVNTLLEYSRIEAGRVTALYQPTDLKALTTELASVFRSATDRAGLQLIVDCGPLSQPVYVDHDFWEQIVLNLLSNAFKFTFEGGITVRLQEKDGTAELSVQDTGVGIPEEELPRIFERFHRVEGSRGRSFEGSGIGLALVQELVKLHGGMISVESTVDKGTTFRLSVPFGSKHLPQQQVAMGGEPSVHGTGAAPYLAEALSWLGKQPDSVDAAIAHEVLPPASPATSSQRVLLVDDNRDMREYIERLLSAHYQVISAGDGRSALEHAFTTPPDLVLTDVMMPEMNGFELLAALRKNPATRTIPIILLSARAGDEARIEGLEHGADDYLVKPFSARELLARVQTHLRLAMLRKNTEEEMQRRAAQFETVLNQAPTGIYLIGGDFRIREVNPVAQPVFGIPDLIGRDFDEVMHLLWTKDYANEVVRIFRHTLETGESYETSGRAEHRIDKKVDEYYSWRVDRIPLPEGGYGVVCYFREISGEIMARRAILEQGERLRKMEKMAAAGQLASSLAHEINNPLSSVMNVLYLLETYPNLDATARSFVSIGASEIGRVARIVQQSLSYYRSGARPRDVDLSKVVNDSLQIFANKFQRAGITAGVKAAPGAIVFGVSDEIRQVIDNLLLNSIEAMPRGGRLSVSVSPSADWGQMPQKGVRLTIADSGQGIPPEIRSRIFEAFFTTKNEKGTGLGLWVSRGIISKHGGSIRMRSSVRTGKSGTAFSIFLPSHTMAKAEEIGAESAA